MKTIVVGYDASDPARRALERAASLAGALGSDVIVTSVAPVSLPAGRGGGPDPTSPPELHQEELEDARRRLESMASSPSSCSASGTPREPSPSSRRSAAPT